ncbi:MAG: type II CRISPR-associated endonuclease Cas1 [Ruminococcus sp.]|nr:type II CRISPR-associated endonuclease Cas1 [Ruminococcus sp.]
MSWRTVVISRRSKLDLKMGCLVVRSEDSLNKVFLDEISVLIIEDTSVSLTGCLISALAEKKIKVVFCDEKRNPSCELVSYYGSHDTSSKVRSQIKWDDEMKACIRTEIAAEKIRHQAELLYETGKKDEADMLERYIEEMEFGDASNREGHAAKVYFNALFGMDFTRSRDCIVNSALNYGYSIILSAFNRECTANGYITQLGLFHDNMFNHFNLSCDLMEPFRVLVDRKVYYSGFTRFEKEEKHSLINIINQTVRINGTEQYVGNAIKIYCKSVFDAVNEKDVSLIKFYSL